MNWITCTPGIALAFVWGFAEGSLFFVVPDVVITLAALLAPRRAWRHVIAATAGALIAGALLYTHAAAFTPLVARVPFVTPHMFTHVEHGYETRGLTALLLGPLAGVPYKIYAVLAPRFTTLSSFLLCSIPARASRFLLAWGVFAFLSNWLKWPPAKLVKLHAAFWIVFYTIYWTTIATKHYPAFASAKSHNFPTLFSLASGDW